MRGWCAIEKVILGMRLEFWGGACSWKIGRSRLNLEMTQQRCSEFNADQHDGKLIYELMLWDIPKLGTQIQLIPRWKRQLGTSRLLMCE
jgi:hypothetical protein